MSPQEQSQVVNSSNQSSVTVTLPSGKIAQAIVNLVVRKKPLGWSRRSHSPYYNEEYGSWVKSIIDRLFESLKPQCVMFSSFPKTKPNTIYLKINQGLMYLIEEMDEVTPAYPRGKYKTLKHRTRISRRERAGVLFEILDEEGELPIATEVVEQKAKPLWKTQIDKYLEEENPNGQPLHLTNVVLSDLEVQQQIAEIDGLQNVLYYITNTEIKLIKGIVK